MKRLSLDCRTGFSFIYNCAVLEKECDITYCIMFTTLYVLALPYFLEIVNCRCRGSGDMLRPVTCVKCLVSD